jgi:GTPase SAR1 family protein
MFIYDIPEKESFENIQNWIDLAFSNSDTVGINFLVGNKSDIENQRQISKDAAKDFANEKNLIFFETSAKSNDNVEKVFEFFTYKLIQYFLNNKDKYVNSDLSGTKIAKSGKDINPNKEEESKCSC